MTWGIFKHDAVSEAYTKMKSEELKGNQVKLDKNKNGKLDKKDFEILRNEDYDDETAVDKSKVPAYLRKDNKLTLKDLDKERTKNRSHPETIIKLNGTQKEEVEVDAEQIDEVKMADLPSTKVQGRSYGAYKPESDYVKGPSDAQLKKIEAEKKKPKKEGLEIFSEKEIDTLINEVLNKDASAGEWIKDFVNSDNPKFAGKSKEQRKKQALGAYYAAQKNESTEYETFLDEAAQQSIVKGAKEIKHANMKEKQDDQEVMEPHSGTEQKFLDAHTAIVTDEPNKSGTPSGSDKVKRAAEPKGKGPGSYDAKEKLGNQKDGIKEDTIKIGRTATGEEGETIDTTPQADSKDKKTFRQLKGTTKAAKTLVDTDVGCK
jgi:hypothetical protein